MSEDIKTDEFLEFFEKNRDRVWVFIDTETLGFNPSKHQLTEVAAKAVKFNGMDSEEISCYHEKAKLLSITRLRMGRPFRGEGLSYKDLMQMTNYGEKTPRGYVEEKTILAELQDFLYQFEDPIDTQIDRQCPGAIDFGPYPYIFTGDECWLEDDG